MRVISRWSFGVLRGRLVVSREDFMMVVGGGGGEEEVKGDGIESEEKQKDLKLPSNHALLLCLSLLWILFSLCLRDDSGEG